MERTNWPASAVHRDVLVDSDSAVDAKSRERLAWTILLSAFVVFVSLVVTSPLAIRWYLTRSTSPQKATLEVNSGTVPVVQAQNVAPIAVAEGGVRDDIKEGAQIRTDSSSQAFLTLFNYSTVVVFPGTLLTLRRMRSPRFQFSDRPQEIVLEVTQGRVRVGVAPDVDRPTNTIIQTPHGVATLREGSYAVESMPKETQLAVRTGEALVHAQGEGSGILLNQGERAIFFADRAPQGPLPAARNLASNGDFAQALAGTKLLTGGELAAGWRVYNDQGGDGGDVDGTASLISVGGRRAARFYRTDSLSNHGETGIIHEINKDVSDYLSVKLRVDIKLVYQSLSGGGDQSSEYPVIVRVNYKDVYGNDNYWTHGFYYQNRDNKPTQSAQRIPQNVWYLFEEPNLKETLVNPRTITSIQIYASGWDYESLISQVGLIAE